MADGPDHFETKGTYKGPLPMLKGEQATVHIYGPTSGRCMVTFDNPETGYVGLHDFDVRDFDLAQEPPQ
jgi:hypothetical protein